MRHRAYTFAAGLGAALLLLPVGAHADDVQSAPPRFDGRYIADADAKNAVAITRLAGDAYHVIGAQWEGVGFFDGRSYWGVFRSERKAGAPESTVVSGTHHGTLRPDGFLGVHGEYTHGRAGTFDIVWSPAGLETPTAPGGLQAPRIDHPVSPLDAPLENEGLPRLGDYVYVEELPEALKKVEPDYPLPGDRKIDGTVIVQALVGRDGRVKDTRVLKSVPMLDDAAVAAARQWVFKPAMTGGKPVAVWVAIPVRFSAP
jgi:TonB family protein